MNTSATAHDLLSHRLQIGAIGTWWEKYVQSATDSTVKSLI